jgi:Ser/Thr protein kinase RdoA (MazF antagonist)
VSRRAGPDVAPVRRVAERFAGTVTGIRRFGRGHINDTYLVDGPAGELVVQRINTAVFPDPDSVTANILAVHRHLQGALMPEPVATSEGDWLVWDESGPWRAWRRVRGAPRPAAKASITALCNAAALVGRFHAGLADLDPGRLTETLPGFHDPARRLDALRAVIAADPRGRVATVEPEIELALASEPLARAAADIVARVPRRVCHFDAKLDNILFDGRAVVCLVDFDTVMPGAWFWDVGDLLRSAAGRAAEDEPDLDRVVVEADRYGAIVGCYKHALAAAGVWVREELDALDIAGAIVTYEQAVRFLTDWIAGDVYYRISRPGHNLDRARNQFRLLASMPRP